MIATKFQAAEPVSHEFFASPCVGAALPAIICAYTYGSHRWMLGQLLPRRRIDPQVVLERAIGVADASSRRSRSTGSCG